MWKHYLDRLFPININRQPGALVIEDRRPAGGLVSSVAIMAGFILFAAMFFKPFIESEIYWLLAICLLSALFFGGRSLLLPIRQAYVFDKERDSYSFRRRTILKNQTIEGSLSQIRAVQIQRQLISSSTGDNTGTAEIFRVALLLRQGLLLGAYGDMMLREETPLGTRYENEARIAYAIADFLNLPLPETVDI